ncbi:hypothetical protein J6590_047957 [Homalodisca vitripennis]|nr:hypothetical protein J6590_047957 [Homalodisca vitripennis]
MNDYNRNHQMKDKSRRRGSESVSRTPSRLPFVPCILAFLRHTKVNPTLATNQFDRSKNAHVTPTDRGLLEFHC